jgi:hypothetical protein
MYIFKTKKSLLAFHIGNNRTNNTFFFSFGYIEYIKKKEEGKGKKKIMMINSSTCRRKIVILPFLRQPTSISNDYDNSDISSFG